MNRFRIVADSSCDLLTLDGADFVSVPLTIRTDTEEFRDDAFLDVNEMVTVLRGTRGRSYSACPNIADWEDAFGERGDVIAFTCETGSDPIPDKEGIHGGTPRTTPVHCRSQARCPA